MTWWQRKRWRVRVVFPGSVAEVEDAFFWRRKNADLDARAWRWASATSYGEGATLPVITVERSYLP